MKEVETEKNWVVKIVELLKNNFKNDSSIFIEPGIKLPYAYEIINYTDKWEPHDINPMKYETDLLIFEKNDEIITPRIVIEAKINSVSTHDAIVYNNKLNSHKSIHPFLRYGIMIGNRKNPLPGRLFRHGIDFDFMVNFKTFDLDEIETKKFIDLISNELKFSRQIEEMILNKNYSSKKKYGILEKPLKLIEF